MTILYVCVQPLRHASVDHTNDIYVLSVPGNCILDIGISLQVVYTQLHGGPLACHTCALRMHTDDLMDFLILMDYLTPTYGVLPEGKFMLENQQHFHSN